jgi:Zn-dependent membrane protease YugP/Tfp pilus assembly protein PilF
MFVDSLYGLFPLLMLLGLYAGLSVAKRLQRSWQQPFTRYAGEMASSGLTGQAVAQRLLDVEGLSDVAVVRSRKISHYRPWRRRVCLNPAAFDEASLPATAVAAHEVGHAHQFAGGYLPARLWRLLWPIFIVLAVVGVAVLVSDLSEPLSVNFGLLTLIPAFVVVQVLMLDSLLLEHDASRRAKKLVRASGLITPGEERGFDLLLTNAFRMHLARVGCFVSMILVLPLLSIDWIAWLPENMTVNNAPTVEPPAITAPIPVPAAPVPDAAPEVLTVDLDVVTPMLWATAITLAFSLFPLLRRAKAWRVAQRCKTGLALQNQGAFDGAIASYSEALRLDRKRVAAYLGRATAFLGIGQLEKALADMDTAIRLAPHVAGLWTMRATLHSSLGNYDQALSDFDRALRLIPESNQVLVGRGLACYWKGDFDRAITDLNQALRLNPNDAMALNNRGAAFLKKGEYASAVADLRQAMCQKPDFPNPYKHLAWIQATCPDPQFRDGLQAVANAFRGLQLAQWKPVDWVAALAAAHAENGDFEEAIKWQTKCIDESPAESRGELQNALHLYQAGQALRDHSAASPRDSVEETGPSQSDGNEADVECTACV